MRITQKNIIITITFTNHMPGTVLSCLYTDSFVYFKGFKAFMYFMLFFLRFYLFIHERHRKKQRHRQREKQDP